MTPCQCGCGQPAPIAKMTQRRRGHVKGQPVRFVNAGHAARRPPPERLWKKVDKHPGDECWVWTGARDPDGYGRIWVAGRMVQAHRLAWELTHGPIPEGQDALHSCDNPPCVRLDHLHLGNQHINVEEMLAKERQARGERIGSAKLTEPQVHEIRRLYAGGGFSQRAIGRRFGIAHQNVSRILTGRTWAHLSAPGQPA